MRRATTSIAIVLAALAVGACGDSPEDDARESGEDIGEQVQKLFTAESAEDAGEAIDSIRAEIESMEERTRERVGEQVETQRGSLEKAGEAIGSGDPDALKQAAQDMRGQSQSFRTTNDSVVNEFWRGFQDGYDDD